MSRRSLMNLAFIMVLAFSGCGRGSGESGSGAGRGTALSDEALIDIMAHSTFLTIELEDYFAVNPEWAVEEFKGKLNGVAGRYGVSISDFEKGGYVEQWERIMDDPQLSRDYHNRLAELKGSSG